MLAINPYTSKTRICPQLLNTIKSNNQRNLLRSVSTDLQYLNDNYTNHSYSTPSNTYFYVTISFLILGFMLYYLYFSLFYHDETYYKFILITIAKLLPINAYVLNSLMHI